MSVLPAWTSSYSNSYHLPGEPIDLSPGVIGPLLHITSRCAHFYTFQKMSPLKPTHLPEHFLSHMPPSGISDYSEFFIPYPRIYTCQTRFTETVNKCVIILAGL